MDDPQVWVLVVLVLLAVWLIVDNHVIRRQVRTISASVRLLRRVVELEHALSTLRKAQDAADATLGAPKRPAVRPPQSEQ